MGATRAGRHAGGRDLRGRAAGDCAFPLPAGRGEVSEGLFDLEPTGLPEDAPAGGVGRGVRPDRSGSGIRSRSSRPYRSTPGNFGTQALLTSPRPRKRHSASLSPNRRERRFQAAYRKPRCAEATRAITSREQICERASLTKLYKVRVPAAGVLLHHQYRCTQRAKSRRCRSSWRWRKAKPIWISMSTITLGR